RLIMFGNPVLALPTSMLVGAGTPVVVKCANGVRPLKESVPDAPNVMPVVTVSSCCVDPANPGALGVNSTTRPSWTGSCEKGRAGEPATGPPPRASAGKVAVGLMRGASLAGRVNTTM